MIKAIKIISIAALLTTLLLFGGAKAVTAQSCSGSVDCCTSTISEPEPGCNPLLGPCEIIVTCSSIETAPCTYSSFSCVDQCADFGAGGYVYGGSCATPPPPTCPSGTIPCFPQCGSCMPNTKTCTEWGADSCGSGGGPPPTGTWGSCGSCGSCPPGPASQCVTTPEGACVWDPGTCGGGGSPSCTVIFQTPPRTLGIGETATIQAFASGAISSWDGTWTFASGWGAPVPTLGTFNPVTLGTGATYVTQVTATTPGTSYVDLRVHADGDYNNRYCEAAQPIVVLNCSPNCSAGSCGQSNGCSGYCPSTDDGGPAAVTNLRVDGQAPVGTTFTISPSANQAVITWTASPTLVDAYEIRLTPQGQTECSGGNTICTTTTNPTYTFASIPAGITTWEVRVRPINTTCAAFGGTDNGAWTATHTLNLVGSVSGSFYLDPGNTCNPFIATPYFSTTDSIRIDGLNGYTYTGGPPLNAASYGFLDIPYWQTSPNNVITFTPGLSPSGTQYDCNCGSDTGGTCVLSGISSPSAGNDFFLREMALDGWWQVWGGNVYTAASSGLGLSSEVPPAGSCSGICSPYLLRQNAASDPDSAGVAVTSGSQVDTTAAADGYNTSQLTDRGSAQVAQGPVIRGTASGRQDFAFFKSRFGLGANPSSDSIDPFNFTKPTGSPANSGVGAYYYTGDVTIQEAWTVAAGESITVFIDGNLTISDAGAPTPNLITVANDGFLAFIVTGDITIEDSVGHSNLLDNSGNIAGIFIANGTITSATNATDDLRLVAEGSYVGWTGVSLTRAFADPADNTSRAIETFIFRPDLIKNLPEPFIRPNYTWQETN